MHVLLLNGVEKMMYELYDTFSKGIDNLFNKSKKITDNFYKHIYGNENNTKKEIKKQNSKNQDKFNKDNKNYQNNEPNINNKKNNSQYINKTNANNSYKKTKNQEQNYNTNNTFNTESNYKVNENNKMHESYNKTNGIDDLIQSLKDILVEQSDKQTDLEEKIKKISSDLLNSGNFEKYNNNIVSKYIDNYKKTDKEYKINIKITPEVPEEILLLSKYLNNFYNKGEVFNKNKGTSNMYFQIEIDPKKIEKNEGDISIIVNNQKLAEEIINNFTEYRTKIVKEVYPNINIEPFKLNKNGHYENEILGIDYIEKTYSK